MILEVCCGNLESVHAAVKGGAPRIELCSRLDLDGLSPLWEELEEARALYPALKIHALIRPREGDFCYCPFYPCGDSSTGGEWIKGKNVWNCKDCFWPHQKEAVDCIREPLEEILEDVDDLKSKKKTLLKLRRACLLNNNPKDL